MAAHGARGRSFLALWLWLLAAAAAADELTPPQRLLKEVSDAVLAELTANRAAFEAEPASLYALVRRQLVPHVDFARLSALALGRSWRGASEAQRGRFAAEFQQLLVRTYATGLLELRTWEIRYPAQRLAPDAVDVTVQAELLRPGAPPVPMSYRLFRDGERWRVYDVTIEGVSLASTYRTSFEEEVRQHGLDRLIDRLAEMNALRPGAGPAG
jgi:phospholipid transport system substrate-binding protein